MNCIKSVIIGLCFVHLFGLIGCASDEQGASNQKKEAHSGPLFSLLPASQTGIDFENTIVQDAQRNIFTFEYYFHGGGTAVGDFNADGLPDVYMVGNISRDALYINKGDLQFENVIETCGITKVPGWTCGVNVIDLNGDGYDDIYLSRGGEFQAPYRNNLLYMNQGDGTFKEESKRYGLGDNARSVHAVFLDFDKDGDLDMYQINTPRQVASQIRKQFTDPPLHDDSDKLYINNGVGYLQPAIEVVGLKAENGYGLSAIAGDFNNDGWDDIYVSNDYDHADYLYINNWDRTFTESVSTYMKHTSNNAMGGSYEDINNDGFADLMVVDMLADDYKRSKRMMATMNINKYYDVVDATGSHQFMRNTLQLNNGNSTYSEIANIAGMPKTDWSWAPCLADFDNDGWRDVYITNGIVMDFNDNDLALKGKTNAAKNDGSWKVEITEHLKDIKSQRLENYAYRNKGDLQFEKVTEEWGLNHDANSGSVAMADFDLDGDIDMLVSNINEPAYFYKNNAQNNFLRIKLIDGGKTLPVKGTRVFVTTEHGTQYQQHYYNQGYLAQQEKTMHFGLGDSEIVKEIRIEWPNGFHSIKKDLAVNQLLLIDKNRSNTTKTNFAPDRTICQKPKQRFNFQHEEADYDDYGVEVLLPHKMSQFGPFIEVADIDGDGRKDFFVGGAADQAGAIFWQSKSGFSKQSLDLGDNDSEDMQAVFFDVDNDKDMDLFVCSGSNEFADPKAYNDRLYINQGGNKFKKAQSFANGSSQCVVAADVNQDGWTDLFVGGRQLPGKYPYPVSSTLLINEKGKLVDQTDKFAPMLKDLGMVTDAAWEDLNGDAFPELITVGEWMDIRVFGNKNGKLSDVSNRYFDQPNPGWWNCIVPADLNGDGLQDFIVGNAGLNTKFSFKEDASLHIYSDDFDQNGTNDIILSTEYEEHLVPVRGRECMSWQLPNIPQQFPTFNEFANSDLEGILGSSEMKEALHYEATEWRSGVLINKGGSFEFKALPNQAQISPINGAVVMDYNQDGIPDIFCAGNFYGPEVETGRQDAGIGLLLEGKGDFKYQSIPVTKSGFFVDGDCRDLKSIRTENGELILATINNGKIVGHLVPNKN